MVDVIHDVLPIQLIREIKRVQYTQDYRTNNSWAIALKRSSTDIKIYDLSDVLSEKIKDEFNSILPNEIIGSNWLCTYTIGDQLSYIPWHTDVGNKFSITVYLNQYWERNYGGLFLYEDSEMKAIVPSYNAACLFTPPINHGTSIVAPHAPKRETLQIFIS